MGTITASYNLALVLLSIAISIVGSYASLRVARQIPKGDHGLFWTALAGFTLGGGAIWSMHFIGMLAFDSGIPVRYGVGLTLLSLVVATLMTGAGFRVVSSEGGGIGRCAAGGTVTGLGVAGMHYMGMAAMQVAATMSFDPVLVAASVVIAVAAATVAMWLAFNCSRPWETAAAAVVMGLAVSGMHYTGMAAATFRYADAPGASRMGAPPELLAFTVFLVAILTIIVALSVVDTPAKRLARRLRHLDFGKPLGVALLLALVIGVPIGAGWWGQATLDRTLKRRLAVELQTVLDADVAALQIWLDRQRHAAEVAASDPEVVRLVQRMAGAAGPENGGIAAQLARYLAPATNAYGYEAVLIIGRAGGVLSTSNDAAVPSRMEFLDRVFDGDATVSPPMRTERAMGASARSIAMYAAGPVAGSDGQVVAALTFAIRPEEEFFRILTIARSGDSGQTYAFDRQGVAISPIRVADRLPPSVSTADQPPSHGPLELELRDPGGNPLTGYQVASDDERPLTRMAEDAVQGRSGLDVDGYRDYRGISVLGAWTWLPNYDFGVVTEVDADEALSRLAQLRRTQWALLGLLATAAVGLVLGHGIYSKMQRRVERVQKLGRYTLEKKIGEGGMGVVYRARHAMLRRPTAVKLLMLRKASQRSVERFEREVQMTSSLTHPNTIAIYDYGRTPEGLFYYAMEFLSGTTLDCLVKDHGPQPEGRVVHILKQVCGSLSEAHGVGLVHRDVKPSNVMLCDRGGQLDVVKVLDFGLVKEIESTPAADLTAEGVLTGTPNYIAPEAIRGSAELDGRSDLYCLGAVGYYLLTGQHVFDAKNAVQLLSHHLGTVPEAPSVRLGAPILPNLERLVMQCLEKDPADRPASGDAMQEALDACHAPWSQAMAHEWHAEAQNVVVTPDAPTGTGDSEAALAVDLHGRASTHSDRREFIEGREDSEQETG